MAQKGGGKLRHFCVNSFRSGYRWQPSRLSRYDTIRSFHVRIPFTNAGTSGVAPPLRNSERAHRRVWKPHFGKP